MLTNNFITLSKSLRSTGTFVHASEYEHCVYLNLTLQRCVDEEDLVQVGKNEDGKTLVRLNIGKHNALYYKFTSDLDSFHINNIPICNKEEVWIAIDPINRYCVFGKES